jgi:hypothetical protein
VLNRRRQLADVLKPETWLRSRAGQLLFGVGLAASPQFADAARKSERRAEDQERKNDDSGNDRDDRDQKNQDEQASDQKNDDKAGAEDRDSSGKSGKRDRNESRSENDESRDQGGADNGKSRGESRRRDDDSDSSSRDASSADDDSGQGGGRRVREFEQQADEPVEETPAPTTVTPANPNVVVDDIPTTSIADLVVEANEDVVATVSTSGGFAFARSGDVIAVTGPDGATIIQTGDVTTGTNGTDPAEPPADGGNNDLDFSS